ncbi:MAG: S41 family peptidase, partial [Planctomycetota bacterium]
MPKRNLIWILAVVAAVAVAALVVHSASQPGRSPQPRFWAVHESYRLILQEYYSDVDSETLQQAAVDGMVQSLDEFSRYVRPGEARQLSRRVRGTEHGLGLRWRIDDAGRVIALVPEWESPAQRAGVQWGDEMLTVDGKPLADYPSKQLRSLLHRRDNNAPVKLTLRRAETAQVETLTLEPADYEVQTVEGLQRGPQGRWQYLADPEGQIAYVRIREFVPRTGQRVRQAFRRLGQASGLILDLRDNPGGMLPAAVAVSDMFLREGTIVTVRRRVGPEQIYFAQGEETVPEIPLVVLVNEQTASAAEIVAGALDFHARAVLVGTRTRGKGCVQSMYPLPDDLGQVNLTTSEFLVGPGRSILRRPGEDRWGVHPRAQQIQPASREAALREARERARARRDPADATTRPASEPTPSTPEEIRQELLTADAQLARAVDVLNDPAEYEALRRTARQAAEQWRQEHEQTRETS